MRKPSTELLNAAVAVITLAVAFISLVVAVRAYESTNKSETEMVDNLKNLNKLSKDTQDKLSELPKNLETLNTAVKDMSENATVQGKTIKNNLDVMEKSVIDFSKKISAYDKELKSITETADKQLALIREQQRKIEEEAKRSPNLAYVNNKISKSSDGKKIDIYPGVVNTGNKMATEVVLYIEFPKELIIQTSLAMGAIPIHQDYVQFTFAPKIIHAMSGGSFTSVNSATPITIDTSKYPNKKIVIYYVIVDSINSYSGSLILDVDSLKMDMSKTEISKP